MAEQQNQTNCSFCPTLIRIIGSSASNPICDECLKKKDSVPSGFPFIMVNEVADYLCPICLSMIENAMELDCTHLMCKACLEYYEKCEIEKHDSKAKFLCSVCQLEYQRDKKKMVGSTDRVIQSSLVVKCLQKQCNDWTGCIKDYEVHEKKCKYILINCQHENCEDKVQRQLIDSHVKRCSFRPIKCDYCEEMVVYQHLKRHHEQCLAFPVSCPNKDCVSVLKRSEINAHCETECQFKQINCPYFEVGCPFKAIHGQMHQHCETFKVNHEFLLLTAVENLKEKSNQCEQKLKEKDFETKQLKASNIVLKQDCERLKNQLENVREHLENKIEKSCEKSNEGEQKLKEKDLDIKQLKASNIVLKLDCESLKNQLENVRKHLETKIERNCERTNDRFKEINEKQSQQSQKSDQVKVDIDNLQTYAERSSKIHLTLSKKLLRRNFHYGSTLFQENYDKDKDVTQWNNMIKAVNEDDNECNNLKTLKDSINQYKQTIYSATYKERLENFCFLTPEGVFRGYFIRFGCASITKYICVKFFDKYTDFAKEVDDERRTCKVQNNYRTCSYHVGDCFHVVVWIAPHKVNLLHKSNEEEKLHLPNGKEVNIGDISNYRFNKQIVLHLSPLK